LEGTHSVPLPIAHHITHKMTWYPDKYYVSQFSVICQFELRICRSWLLDVLLIPVWGAVRCGVPHIATADVTLCSVCCQL
jgi:hypothetical protein